MVAVAVVQHPPLFFLLFLIMAAVVAPSPLIPADSDHTRDYVIDPSATYLLIDIEGVQPNILELTISAYRNHTITDIFHD